MAEREGEQMATDDQLHWGISYLREDLQGLRHEVRQEVQGLRQELRELAREMQRRFEDVNGRVQEAADALRERMDRQHHRTLAAMVALAGVIIAAIRL